MIKSVRQVSEICIVFALLLSYLKIYTVQTKSIQFAF